MEYGRWILVAAWSPDGVLRCTQIWIARSGLAGALGPPAYCVWLWRGNRLAGRFAGNPAATGFCVVGAEGRCERGFPKEASATPYWQASQSGSSIAQAFGTGAGPAAWIGALSPPLETALSLPVLMVDFSVLVAARARR
ncbi:hypothetical protein D3C81_1425970 [compost metagenome]